MRPLNHDAATLRTPAAVRLEIRSFGASALAERVSLNSRSLSSGKARELVPRSPALTASVKSPQSIAVGRRPALVGRRRNWDTESKAGRCQGLDEAFTDDLAARGVRLPSWVSVAPTTEPWRYQPTNRFHERTGHDREHFLGA